MRHERSLNGTTPPKTGMEKEISSATPLSNSAGKMRVVCLNCDTTFFRFASHVRRRAKNYCSVGCRQEGLKVQIHTKCVVCGADMLQSPSLAQRVTTCSKECSSNRKRGKSPSKNWPEYKSAVAEVSALSLCCCCGKETGPWVVRGLLPEIDRSKASLWCRTCHVKDILMKARDSKHAAPDALEKAKRMLEKHGYAVSSNYQ
jgi:hypothetical protein